MTTITDALADASPFIILVIMLTSFMVFIGYVDARLELKCREYLQNHGYDFVSYDRSSIFSHEECWGSKNGTSMRVYTVIGDKQP